MCPFTIVLSVFGHRPLFLFTLEAPRDFKQFARSQSACTTTGCLLSDSGLLWIVYMALLSEEMDSDLLRLWNLIHELSEQLNNNRAIATSLQLQAAQAKVVGSGISMLSCPN